MRRNSVAANVAYQAGLLQGRIGRIRTPEHWMEGESRDAYVQGWDEGAKETIEKELKSPT